MTTGKTMAKRFGGAFAATLILIGTVCGFVIVDLSTDRYMPTQTGTIFAVNEISQSGISLVITGQQFRIDSAPPAQVGEFAWQFRGLVPGRLRVAAKLAELVYEAAEESAEPAL